MRIGKKFSGALAVACLMMIVCSLVLPISALAADGPDSSATGKTSSSDNSTAGQTAQNAAQGVGSAPTASQGANDASGSQSFAIITGLAKLRADLAESSSGNPSGASNSGRPEAAAASAKTNGGQSTTQSSQGSQATQQQTTQQPNPITQPLAASPDVGPERVGVDLNQVESLTLQDAIGMALRNNLGIESARQSVRMAQYSLFSYRGVYDITSTANLNFNDSTVPVANIFSGAGNSGGAISTKTVTYNFSTSQLLQPTGGTWTVNFNNNRQDSSNQANVLNPQYVSTLQIVFQQPLMRNLSIDANRRQIQILKRNLDVSDSQFRQEVIQIINQVQDAYWNLVFAIKNEKIARGTVDLTRTQLENDRKQVEAGTAAPIDLRSDEAALEARKGDVINALQGVTTAENVVKSLLLKDPTDKVWNSVISPTDEPEFGQPTLNVDEALRVALKNRPELEQLRLQSQNNDTNVKFYKNQLKPQVDFIGVYGGTGLAGSTFTTSQGGPLTPQGDLEQITINKLNRLLGDAGIKQIATTGVVPAQSAADQFAGGYLQAVHNLFGQSFRTWQVGVSISLPWGNHAAKGNLGFALAQTRQTDAQIRQEMQLIEVDVRNALQAVEAAWRSYLAAKAGRIAAQAQLDGTVEKFRAGLTTNFFVLQYQTDLATAEGTEVRALTNYDIALANLQAVTGMTLINNNVNITSGKDNSVK